MSDVFDPNKVVSDALTKLVQDNFNKIWAGGKGAAKSVYLDAKVFTASHKRYLTQVAKDYHKAKSFLIQATKTPLYNFYVPLGITRGETQYPEASIENLTFVENFNVITGSGGSGKSMMMRHLFLDTLQKKPKVPVFCELRDLNGTNLTVRDLVKDTLYQNKFTQDEEFFERALKAGHFAVFLDGFDETDDREKIARDIQKFAKEYDENIITVSSRPDDALSAWTLFNVWQIQPLTLEKACDLVEKVPAHIFDAKIKKKFLDDLKDKLFESHKSFLSNPLLLSIMVLTYKDSADIPQKLSVFYDQAYTTLFQRHDALKGGYKRKRYCDLDIQDFAKVFSAFSILTHDKRKSSFTETEALEFLGKAKKLANIEFDEKGFLDDAIQAVSLLIRDGLVITFAHRSFQEYFTAQYIRQVSPGKQRKLIDKYIYGQGDNVTNLLFNIDKELFEKNYLIPGIQELENKVRFKNTLKMSQYSNILKLIIDKFVAFKLNDTFEARRNHQNSYATVIIFVFENYIKTKYQNYVNQAFDKEFTKKLFEKFASYKEVTSIEVSATKVINDLELLNIFIKSHEVISFQTIQKMFELKSALVKKYAQTELSIEEELLS